MKTELEEMMGQYVTNRECPWCGNLLAGTNRRCRRSGRRCCLSCYNESVGIVPITREEIDARCRLLRERRDDPPFAPWYHGLTEDEEREMRQVRTRWPNSGIYRSNRFDFPDEDDVMKIEERNASRFI